MGKYTEEIIRNAEIIKRLSPITFKYFDYYDSLAFPGGYAGALDRILEGDPKAMEAGICFLEVRPYFNQSGYMFKDIIRKLKKAPLDEDQRKRFEAVLIAYAEYRKSMLANRE
ncbi:MAG: hypothetical protein ACQ9MH_12330 [Nitrospinales bacterium]